MIWSYRKHRNSPLPNIPNHPLDRAQLIMIYVLLFSPGTASAQLLPELGGHASFFAFMSYIILALASVWLLLLTPSDGAIPCDGKSAPDIIFSTNSINRLLRILAPIIILGIIYISTTLRDLPSSGSHLHF